MYTSIPELHVASGAIPCSISDLDIIYIILKHSHKSKTVCLNTMWQLFNRKSIAVQLFVDTHSMPIVEYYKDYTIERHELLVIISIAWNVRGIDIVKDLGWLSLCQGRDYFTAITVLCI